MFGSREHGQSDESTVQSTRTPEQQALLEQLNQHWRRMWAMLHVRHVPPSQIDDIIQESMRKATEKIAQYDGSGSFEGWLWRICWHTWLDLRKSHVFRRTMIVSARAAVGRYSRPGIPEALDTLPCSDAHFWDEVEANDLYERLLLILDGLKEDVRKTMHLLLRGFSPDEIAGQLGITVAAVNMRISRARSVLEKYCRVQGMTGPIRWLEEPV